MQTNDFFFGDIYVDNKTLVKSISLHDANALGALYGATHFTAQIGRFLREHKSLVMRDGTSHPPFPELLSQLDVTQIGLVKIATRTNINDNVPVTLDCSLVFVDGVVNVRPHWTAYKELRAWEIVDSLLLPLHRRGLIDRTVYSADGTWKKLGADIEQQIKLLFKLSGFVYDSTNHGNIESYLERFKGSNS